MTIQTGNHGARSQELVAQKSAFQKRRLLRLLGVSRSDLGAIALAYLDNWARVRVQLMLLDRWLAKHRPELVDEAGNLPPFAAYHVALLNSERNAITRLALHLPADVEVDELAERYRNWTDEESA